MASHSIFYKHCHQDRSFVIWNTMEVWNSPGPSIQLQLHPITKISTYLKVARSSFKSLNFSFVPFGGLIRLFVHVLTAQTSAGQVGPESKIVCQRVWKNSSRDFKKIYVATLVYIDLHWEQIEKNLLENTYCFCIYTDIWSADLALVFHISVTGWTFLLEAFLHLVTIFDKCHCLRQRHGQSPLCVFYCPITATVIWIHMTNLDFSAVVCLIYSKRCWSKIISHSTSSCHVSGLVYLPTSFFSNAKMHFSSKCHWITSVSMEFNVQNMGMLSIIVTNVFGFHEKYYFSYYKEITSIEFLKYLNLVIERCGHLFSQQFYNTAKL